MSRSDRRMFRVTAKRTNKQNLSGITFKRGGLRK